MVQQVPWDEYEACLLIDAYQRFVKRELSQREAIILVSGQLRHLAEVRSLEIDDSYRNLEGISHQFWCIKCIFEDLPVNFKMPQLFLAMYRLYNEDFSEYNRLLIQAQGMLEEEVGSAQKTKSEVQTAGSDEPNLHRVLFAENESVMYCKPISFQFVNEKKMPVRFWADLYGKIVRELDRKHGEILARLIGNNLSSGGRIAFSSTREGLKAPYCVRDGLYVETNYSATDIVKLIGILLDKCGIDREDLEILYIKKKELKGIIASSGRREKVTDPKLDAFSRWLLEDQKMSESSSIGYASNLVSCSAFCISSDLIQKSILDYEDEELQEVILFILANPVFCERNRIEHNRFSSALKKYLVFRMSGQGDFEFNQDSISTELLEEHIRSAGLAGTTPRDIVYDAFPDAKQYKIREALQQNKHIIDMPNDRFVHMDCLIDLDDAKDILGKILKTHFNQFGGYSNSKLLYGAAEFDLSMFINDNDCGTEEVIYAIAKFLFSKSENNYTFSSPHIFEHTPDFTPNQFGLLVNRARQNNGILDVNEAESYIQKLRIQFYGVGQTVNIKNGKDFLIYDANTYLLTESLGIDDSWCKAIYDRLDSLFARENIAYLIPRDISEEWLRTLPALPHGLVWTRLLLQDVIKKFSEIGFRAIFTKKKNQRFDTIAAAFVSANNQDLLTFADVVWLHMKNMFELPYRIKYEDLRAILCQAGMIEGDDLRWSLNDSLDNSHFAWESDNAKVLIR